MSILHGPNNNSGSPILNVEEYYYFLAAVLATSNTVIHANITQPTSGTTVVTTAITNPDVPRNVTITGNQATCTGNVVVAGTDFHDEPITETLAANGTSTVVGNKAFRTVTSITIPTRGAASDAISVGVGSKLGFPLAIDVNMVTVAHLNKVREATLPTVATSATYVISDCTFTLNSSLNGNSVGVLFHTY